MKLINLLLLVFLVGSCKETHTVKPLFSLVANSNIDFENTVQHSKDFNIFNYRNFYNGGGVATGDINNDGLADVFFTANMGANKLYLNKGNFEFEDISEKAGFINKVDWSTGVVMVDLNGDGWLDIFVCNAGYIDGNVPSSKLYINNRDLTFKECAKEYGLANEGEYTTHAAFFDYDLDGDLDCYILNNSFIPVNTLNYANKRNLRAKDWPVADFLKGGGDKLLRNDNGTFIDVSVEAHIYGSLIGFGLGVTVSDVNGDQYPDIYISNDFFERDYLYINQKDGTYREALENWVQHTSLASMGADVGDVNNDGYPDIFTTDMLPDDDYRLKTTSSFDNYDVYHLKETQGFYHQFMQNTLQINNGCGKFMDAAHFSNVAASDWSWGGLLFDADNDGYSDLYICNGIYHDVTDQDFIDYFANDVIQAMAMTGKREEVDQIINKMPSRPIANKAFRNLGNLRFSDEGRNWGFTQPSFSNGAAYADLDNDGDLDLVVNNVNQKAFVYRNNSRETTHNNYIGFALKGHGQNTFAIGTTVKVYAGDQVLSREIMPSRGFQSSVDYKVIIGLGAKEVDSAIIIWPDRRLVKMIKPRANSVYRIAEGEDPQLPETKNPLPQPFLVKASQQRFDKHEEDDYVDFYYERGQALMLSREGPRAACGDVNGDGLEDVYIGGTAKKPGQLYIQTANGFSKKKEAELESGAGYEDVATLLFDCDKDGDLDLLIGSGGNNHPENSFQLQNRLYKNDGKGNFTLSLNALPNSGGNTSVVIANDVDGDGDLDLFIGSRSVPQNYGPVPHSFLLINDGQGRFKDIAEGENREIGNVGLVTSAVWVDIDGDRKKDLVVVGDWMAPRAFSFKNGRFTEMATGLSNLKGWWQTIAADDLDGDGDQDLILGNIGENFYLHPDDKSPVKMWVNDFDNNGTSEKIITRTINGKDMPVFLKRELTDQIASLKKQNLQHKDFAKRSIQELFPPEVLKKSSTLVFNYPSSCIAINEGGGRFRVRELPDLVQLSSVNAILCRDVNGDSKKDLILGGNIFCWQPQFGRLDASYGTVLLNDGQAGFKWIPPIQSGLELRGEIRDIQELKNSKGGNFLLFLQNDDYPVMYEFSKFKK